MGFELTAHRERSFWVRMRGGRARTWDTKEAGLSSSRSWRRRAPERRSLGPTQPPPRATRAPARSRRRRSTPPRAWKPLRSASASATSFLQNNWNRFEENYHPSYVLDENPATAWVEGAAGFGIDESITIPLSAVRVARAIRLRIWNGYQKSMHLWTKNAMPNRVRITVFDPRGAQVASPERELARQLGPQEVVVELPPGSGVGSVRLTILSVYEGQKYDDTCVSDILVDVDSDVKHNAAAENAKLAALKQWVGTRKTTAAYFASKPVEFPFAFTKYVEAKREVDWGDFKKRFAAREEIVKTLGAERFKAGAKSAVRAFPDGLANTDLHLEDFGDLLRADCVALLATTEPIRDPARRRGRHAESVDVERQGRARRRQERAGHRLRHQGRHDRANVVHAQPRAPARLRRAGPPEHGLPPVHEHGRTEKATTRTKTAPTRRR